MKKLLILLIAAIMILTLFSCREEDNDNVDYVAPTEEVTYLEDIVRLPEYKGLSVIRGVDESRGDAIWEIVLEGSEIVEYPDSFLSYYVSQTLTKYKIMANEGGVGYLELLDMLGMTEEDVNAEARELAKAELVAMAIIEKEGIELTGEEVDRLYDRYAEKIAAELGKDVAYVKQKLSSEVYETMRRDKMIEFLITQNDFVSEE